MTKEELWEKAGKYLTEGDAEAVIECVELIMELEKFENCEAVRAAGIGRPV